MLVKILPVEILVLSERTGMVADMDRLNRLPGVVEIDEAYL